MACGGERPAAGDEMALPRRVLQMPWHGHYMCPFADAGLGVRYLTTPVAERFGHPLRKLHRIAFNKVDMCGLHSAWWAN